MSVSKKALKDKALCAAIVSQYRSFAGTMGAIAERNGVTYHTVSAVLKQELSPEEKRSLRGAYHSLSKTGALNPMHGVRKAAERIMRKGRASQWNGSGYTFEHRTIVAKSLGLEELPPHWEVHHIDEDKTNNDLNNLAIVTKSGHQKLHRKKVGLLYAWEKEMFGTSLLKEMKAISQGG